MVVKTRTSVQGAVPKQSIRKASALKLPQMAFMLGDDGEPVTPPWLIDTPAKLPKVRKSKAPAKPAAKKSAKAKTAAPKTPATRKPRAKAVVQAQPAAVMVSNIVAPPIHPVASVPLTRAQAPVVWQKNGPISAISFWFRATGRTVMARFGAAQNKRPRTGAPIGAKLRTKNDLLREIAVLRKENAAMRDRLGLPPMPFGRILADKI